MEDLIAQAAADLQKPAGPSLRFSSFNGIRKNRKAFVRGCHKTWKRWHERAVGEILTYDAFARREKTHPVGPDVEEWGEYTRAVGRRVNDAIVWCLVGMQRHVVKRLCLYRERTYLSESNATSAMSMVAALNSHPMRIAIWNDATSCVDIGDITYIENGLRPVPQFLELKAGTVNAAIVQLLQTAEPAFDAKFASFKEQYGKKGVDQFNRVIRQKKTGEQALSLLTEERGIDPVTGHEVKVIETNVEAKTYDTALNEMLTTALNGRKEVFERVDNCLWIFCNGDKAVKPREVRIRFDQLLQKSIPDFQETPKPQRPSWDKDVIVNLNWGFRQPMAVPIFLRKLDHRIVASITYGDLMNKTYLYLDWSKFADLVREEGGEFIWSSEREARKARTMHPALRPPVVRGRIPQARLGGAIGSITDPNLVELLFDGITPRTTAKRHVEGLRNIIDTSDRK